MYHVLKPGGIHVRVRRPNVQCAVRTHSSSQLAGHDVSTRRSPFCGAWYITFNHLTFYHRPCANVSESRAAGSISAGQYPDPVRLFSFCDLQLYLWFHSTCNCLIHWVPFSPLQLSVMPMIPMTVRIIFIHVKTHRNNCQWGIR